MSKLIDGKLVSNLLKDKVAKEVKALNCKGIDVGLAVILAGDNPASEIYVRNKTATCKELGIKSYEYKFDSNATTKDILKCIKELN